jgi:hypothetical protein
MSAKPALDPRRQGRPRAEAGLPLLIAERVGWSHAMSTGADYVRAMRSL